MNLQVDVERLLLAHKAVRAELLAERNAAGFWEGRLASSPLATATAISALVTAHQVDTIATLRTDLVCDEPMSERLIESDLSEFLVESVHWLARHQNPDGGWGDCEAARSNVAATMLVQAAFRLTGVPAKYADLMVRADQYIAREGGLTALRQQYGKEKTLVAAILANCALAGMVSWRQVPTLPFELILLPKRWQRLQTSFAPCSQPLLLAVGLAKFHHSPPWNPITRLLRQSIRAQARIVLERLQAADDSFLALVPFTAFVVMSLASCGLREHAIVRRGIQFLLSLTRGDASWPITGPLATTNTALAVECLAAEHCLPAGASQPLGALHAGSALAAQHRPHPHSMAWEDTASTDETMANTAIDESVAGDHASATEIDDREILFSDSSLDWLLGCQHDVRNSLTCVPPGGWGWSATAGALPNSADTSRVLCALAHWPRIASPLRRERFDRAVKLGIEWLLVLQNEDGGWPTFYRDSHSAPMESSSGTDTTAGALRALAAWQRNWQGRTDRAALLEQSAVAIERGWKYLQTQQRGDGSLIPLWFGNENQPGEHNPVCGTAQVLLACAALMRLDTDLARQAARWLVSAQHACGGWGPPRAPREYSGAVKDGFRAWQANEALGKLCSIEETALAVQALLPLVDSNDSMARAVSAGLNWLTAAVEQDLHRRPAVIGFSLAKIWYYERLYPFVFAAGALCLAENQLAPRQHETAAIGTR